MARKQSENKATPASVAPPDPDALQTRKRVNKGLVLHFMVQLSVGEDADQQLNNPSMGRVHHRILYMAHFAPGITVSELLEVLGVKHQNIQGPLRQLVNEGFIAARASKKDARVKQLYCSRKGDKLLEALSKPQWDRFQKGYDSVTTRDVEGYFKVMNAMLDPQRQYWVSRLTETDEPA